MAKVSIIIPSRNERFMPETVQDLFAHATGEIEVIVVLEGYWPEKMPEDRPNLHYIHRGQARGMRAAINSAAAIATGEWLMKCDAHCSFDLGYDEVLKRDCAEKNWLLIPRRYSLDAEKWERRMEKTPIDYHYLDCPMTNPEYFQFHGVIWPQRAKQRANIMIDETMSWQGSMWFMHRDHFFKRLGGMDEKGYGTFSQEPQEIGNKTWLGGGAIMVTKNTWYSHLHKGKQWGRMYSISQGMIRQGHEYSANYWMSNSWPERVHDIEWLIDKFWPLPNWPDNWRELLNDWRQKTNWTP